MRNRSRSFDAFAGLTAGFLLLGATSPVDENRVTVEIAGLRSADGMILACMTTRADRFPNCNRDPQAHRIKVAARNGTVLDFGVVEPGNYAIAASHDENGNGKVDRALGMIPTEGFGFSRDAPVVMGPPRFARAAFTVSDGEQQRQRIHIRYML